MLVGRRHERHAGVSSCKNTKRWAFAAMTAEGVLAWRVRGAIPHGQVHGFGRDIIASGVDGGALAENPDCGPMGWRQACCRDYNS